MPTDHRPLTRASDEAMDAICDGDNAFRRMHDFQGHLVGALLAILDDAQDPELTEQASAAIARARKFALRS